ncbi:MAG: c-type cytochrome [Ardenticatenaceae bacterium]
MKRCRSVRLLGLALLLVLAALLLACAEQRSEEPEKQSALIEQGEALYDANCRSCHGGATGGQMMDIPPPHNSNGHTWHHADCQLKEIVLNGSGEMGEMMREMMGASPDTPRMPAFKGQLTEKEVEAVLAYIKTLWAVEQRDVQARMTEARC